MLDFGIRKDLMRRWPAGNSMFLQWCRDELVLSFIFVQRFRFVGQDAASQRHHCRNTNVGCNIFKDIRVTIQETDIRRTFKEKLSDFLNTTLIGQLILFIIWLLAIIIFPIFLILGLTWENVVEKYFYKLTGKGRKNFQSEHKDPFKDLSIKVEFEHIFSTEGQVEKIKEKFKLPDRDFDELEIGQYKTDPAISDIQDKYFDFNSFVFDNKVFVQEVKLPSFKTDIGYIDCTDLKYNIIKTLDSYPTIKFTDKGDTLEILLRQPKMKKLISVDKKYSSQQ